MMLSLGLNNLSRSLLKIAGIQKGGAFFDWLFDRETYAHDRFCVLTNLKYKNYRID